MLKFEIKQNILVITLAMGLTSLNVQGDTLSGRNKTNKTLPTPDQHALLIKELAQLNKRTKELNNKVARLEAEKNTTKRHAKKPLNKNYLWYKTTVFYRQPHLITPDEKDGINYFLYLDKSYYDISPGDLNQTRFFQIINQNSPLSTADNNLCIKNALCFSALTNIDLRFYNHEGGLLSRNGEQTNSLVGLGVRPLFAEHYESIFGSINNANLFIDGYVNPNVSAHLNLAYVNGSVKIKSFQHEAADWASVYDSSAAVKMDEIFLTLVLPDKPFFVRLGKQYLNFGDYKPYPITESLVQLMTQMRTGAIIGGFVLPNGLYGSANYSMSRESLEDASTPLFASPLAGNDRARNFGGKIGYGSNINAIQFNVNASYIYDLRDSDYLNEQSHFYSTEAPFQDFVFFRTGTANQVFLMSRAPGLALHADAHWNRFGMLAEYASALHPMNPSVQNSKISAWGLHGNMTFNILKYCSIADLGYERGYNANVYQTVLYGPPPVIPGIAEPIQLGNALPQSRLVGTFAVNVLRGVTLSAQWVHDKDFPSSLGGNGITSDLGVLRVSAQL